MIKTQCVADLRDIFEKGSGLAENYAVTLESTGELSYDGLVAIVIFPVKDTDAGTGISDAGGYHQ